MSDEICARSAAVAGGGVSGGGGGRLPPISVCFFPAHLLPVRSVGQYSELQRGNV